MNQAYPENLANEAAKDHAEELVQKISLALADKRCSYEAHSSGQGVLLVQTAVF